MKRFLGLFFIAGAGVAFLTLLLLGRLGKVVSVSSSTTTSGNVSSTFVWAQIDVNWFLVLPLAAAIGIGLFLILWRPRSRVRR